MASKFSSIISNWNNTWYAKFFIFNCIIVSLGVWYYLYKNKTQNNTSSNEDEDNSLINENQSDDNSINLEEISDNSQISMQLGYGLIQLVDDNNEGPLILE